ncbi:hypothetical protein RHSIM_Rhsim02G0098300 [Rhododendron simsii]|uniref:Wax synthase domain-containing protein n=1 Tax=Rhododendron simsii TaxID=118357 RepID=A0A834HG67_RHOSS|nr:hypothetical protein RHSIM_Rhsim02G0098300 [Rhododendron simsii]
MQYKEFLRIQQNPPPKPQANLENSLTSQNRDNPYPLDQDGHNSQNGNTSIRNYAIKVVLLALFWPVYEYSDHLHPKVMWLIYGFHMNFTLEIILATAAAVARALFGLELEQQFDQPYLSTSVQNFWGRRWNLVVSRTLRSTVYELALCISEQVIGWKWTSLPAVLCKFVVSSLMSETLFYYMGRLLPVWEVTWFFLLHGACVALCISEQVIGWKWTSLPAVLCKFVVSSLMSEILFYYMGRLLPVWEVTWFFLLHGACVVAEIWIKKVVKDRWRLPRLISTPMSVGFVMVTGFWLFIPQLLRCKLNIRVFEEDALLVAFVKDVVAAVVHLTWALRLHYYYFFELCSLFELYSAVYSSFAPRFLRALLRSCYFFKLCIATSSSFKAPLLLFLQALHRNFFEL